MVTDAEMQRFHATYCLADEACRILQVSRTTLARWEEQGLIQPVYGRRTHSRAGASVFRREDVKNTRPQRRRCA
jgi:predicted site-specific integrase-resolvase